MSNWLWIVLTLVIFLVGYVLSNKTKEKEKNLPPGPKGYPLLGSLNLLGKNPHRDLQRLSQKYGPIMHMQLGLIPTIVVSSPKAAELFLKTHDLVFASRPPHLAAKHMAWEQTNLSFSLYGSYWRNMRKMCTIELLSSLKISTFRAMRREEIGHFIEFTKNATTNRVAVDLSAKITACNTNMSCRTVFGKKYSDEEFDPKGFNEIIKELMYLGATPNLGDYIPFLAPLDLQGLTKRMKVVQNVFDEFFEGIIDEHIQSKAKDDHEAKDFVDDHEAYSSTSKNPHRDLERLSQKYGPIMHMQLGLIPTIVVSSSKAAELFLKTHDLVFASRPPHLAAKHMSWEQRNLSFAQYGSYWRDMRKMCTLELLSSLKISTFRAMRREEISHFIDSMKNATMAVDLSAKITTCNTDMSCRMVFGKKYSDDEFDPKGFKEIIKELMHLGAAPNLGDYIPFLAPLDLQGLTKRMKAVQKVFDEFFEGIIDEHIQSKAKDDHEDKDFVDVMLRIMGSEQSEYRIERPNIKAIILDMLIGSMDTSSTAIEWAISELIKHPTTMKKLQEEIKTMVGMERLVEESDLEKLPYLDMVIKESMRLHPVAPLLLPHAAAEDSMVNGFYIPQNSRVLINFWTIGRDPECWTEPEKFFPERFSGSDIDLKGRDFEFIPFGSGRRGCPGMQLGLLVVRLMVAQLVHCFDWELPDGMVASELDMSEEFGLTTTRVQHLVAIPSYRLKK
ncbi:hypothetical protein F8388_025791 [Cannabis sativa]|uniref:Cytochrome P450 n=1 Tax=Cannabis sativa TaxID=3483 RepID=A0A7J6F9G9_CANSA|nr:hypothetical protein F8388_025791 [Cannabis sativa]